MLKISNEFQLLLNDRSIEIENNNLDNAVRRISIHVFTKDNITQIPSFFQLISKSKIIICDEYVEEISECNFDFDFFLLCFDNRLLIIQQSEFQPLFGFFSQVQSSSLFLFSEFARLKLEQIKFPVKISDKNENFFYTEIQSFSKSFLLKFNKKCDNQKQILNFWNTIKEVISAYLIKKAYINSRFERKFLLDETKNIDCEVMPSINEKDMITLRTLGDGSLSFVYLVYHIKKEKIFSLKVFSNESYNQRTFQRECTNYLNIHHPLFPIFYGSGKYMAANCIVYEYIEGDTLKKATFSSRKEKICFIFQLMTIFEYLHINGYIYRDLKPNNIIIDDNKTCFLIDFDKMIKNESGNEVQVVTKNLAAINFQAPEINSSQISNKVDIYSIGEIINYVFCDELSNDVNEEYLSLHELVDDCTSIDPIKRPTISQLIDRFYFNFLTSVSKINEGYTIKSIADIHSEKYFPYWFAISEFDKDPNYQILFGFLYEEGKMFHKNTRKANYYFKLAAENEHSDALCMVADQILNGYLSDDNVNKAISYLSIAASKNHTESLFKLGLIYYDLKNDYYKAVQYLTPAANQNHCESQYILGNIYENGLGLQKDINKSIHFYSLAANQNHEKAQFKLGEIYEKGINVNVDIKKAIFYYSLAANQNDSESQFKLGHIYEEGIYVPFDINKAIHYYTLAANNRHRVAMFNLAFIYYEANYVKQDINKAIHYFTILANDNDEVSQYNIGFLYYEGKYVEMNVQKRIFYLTLAAQNGFAEAQFYLGKVYELGTYVERDMKKAISFYTLAANQNDSKSQYALGIIYHLAQFVPRDINKAIHYYELAAKNHDIDALFNLGTIYYRGEFTQINMNKAIHYYSLAANQGCVRSQFNLGVFYEQGKLVQRDMNKSIYYYNLASNQNYANAQFNLGLIYDKGNYVAKDLNRAIHFYTLAANQNHSHSQANLSELCFSYLHDDNKGVYYLTLSANQGEPQSQFNLGCWYINGKYLKQNIEKGIHYLTLSANRNYSDAQCNLGVLYFSEEFLPLNVTKSIHYFTLAANNGNKIAQYYLGRIYFEGLNVTQNIKKGIDYFFLASKNNHIMAHFVVGTLYFKGKYIEQNIDEAICHYKEGSSFNDQYCKNNLGIIYLKYKKNVTFATELFQEAISKKNDHLSMFNLAHIYYFDQSVNKDIKKVIELLIKSSEKVCWASVLLSLIFVKMVSQITVENINEELLKYGSCLKNLKYRIYCIILCYRLTNNANYKKTCAKLENKILLYDTNFCRIDYNKFISLDQKNLDDIMSDHFVKITKSFYEGFGYDLL